MLLSEIIEVLQRQIDKTGDRVASVLFNTRFEVPKGPWELYREDLFPDGVIAMCNQFVGSDTPGQISGALWILPATVSR